MFFKCGVFLEEKKKKVKLGNIRTKQSFSFLSLIIICSNKQEKQEAGRWSALARVFLQVWARTKSESSVAKSNSSSTRQ